MRRLSSLSQVLLGEEGGSSGGGGIEREGGGGVSGLEVDGGGARNPNPEVRPAAAIASASLDVSSIPPPAPISDRRPSHFASR